MDSLDAGRGRKRLGEFIRESKGRILEAWSEAVRGLPAAAPLSQPQLLDHMPDLLDRIAEVTESAHTGRAASLEGFAEIHALDRLDEGFDLDGMVSEFSLLRGCVLDLYLSEHSAEIRVSEVNHFNRAIDEAVRSAVNRYQQAHERTLVALDRVSAVALAEGHEEQIVARLLQVMLETTAAVDSATILLREGDRLIVRASVGLLEERNHGFSLAIGEGFAGTIAQTGKPLFLRSAATDPLVKSPFIRERGIRALYGAPLLRGEEVIGVVHIGSTSAWDFSNEDKLLFRAMAERVSALLTQARSRERERRARLEAEAALAQLDAFYAGSPLAAAFFDRELRYVRVNEALARANGRPVAEHLGRTLWEVLPQALADQLAPLLRRALESKEPILNLEIEGAAPSSPGDVRTLLLNYFPVKSASGEVLGVGGTVLDITERKRAVRALEEQKRLYQSLLQAMSDLGEGYALVEGGRITIVSDALCRMTGYPQGELLGLPTIAALAAPGERAAYQERLSRMRPMEPHHDELTVLRKDGQPVDLEISTLDLGGGRRIKVTRDITYKKRAAQERERLVARIEEAHRQLEAILENLPVGVVVYGAGPNEGRLLSNHRAEQILGTSVTGALFDASVLHPDGTPYRPEERPLMRSLRAGEFVRDEEFDYLRPDGARRTLAASSAPIRDGQGRIVAAVAAFEDVTERKRTQDELKEALDFRDRMLSILGHDLRNPLSVIRTATHLLYKRGNLAPHAHRAVSSIDHAADRMGELIRTLLDFSQSRFRGGLPIAPVQTDLGQIVTDLAHEAEASMPGSRVEVHLEGDARGVWDPHRLSQLVSNLLGNAQRHGDWERPVTVEVRGEEQRVVLRVHNWGPPIPREALPRLFEAFQRGSGHPGERRKEGLGLGLFISREVVRAHQGTIEVSSSEREGTMFTVSLPRRPAPPAEPGRGA